MADTTTVKYLWPPNFDGNPPEDGKTGWNRIRVLLTCISDGTGETAVKKVDISDLRRTDGQPVVKTAVEKIQFASSGFTSIKLEWDRTPRETIVVIPGGALGAIADILDFTDSGGLVEQSYGSDGTGDILLTTAGASNGDSYNIIISLRLM